VHLLVLLDRLEGQVSPEDLLTTVPTVGEERLDETLGIPGDLDGLLDALSSSVAGFAGERRREDDWTILALRFL
jgi:serine phosphatase RsbU (regulator of sigma subunit)